MNTIGKRIQYLLDKDAMTSYQFCRQTGFSEASLSRILHSSNRRIELLFQQLEKLSHENEELKTQISKKKQWDDCQI